ncbi:MAG: hypothetical protein K0R65_3047 [Crocinitomicaceae bacterium]|nr:hypothetical protein [Crocinitomicaceae bacterium]
MKNSTKVLALLFGAAFLASNLNAQIKIKKPEIEVSKPTIGKGSGSSDDKSIIPGKDPSGLFSKVTDDPSAQHHRKTAVANLSTLEAEFAKSSIDYEALTKLMFENERTLGHIKKLEPNADASKYYEKYNPLKERADKENATYAQVSKLEKLFESEFRAPTEFKTPEVSTFTQDASGNAKKCYCHDYRVKSYEEFSTNKAEYEKLTAQLVGYSNEDTKKVFSNMDVCLQNGNKYAIWASKENLQAKIVDYNTKNTVADPKGVIRECDEYMAALNGIEKDKSLNLSTEAKNAIADGKKNITKIKTENETYISSGAYQKYLDKMHAEQIAKVFLPKAVTSNPTMEENAKKYVKGAEFAEYLKGRGDSPVASTVKAVTLTREPYVKKNEYDLPVYQYHEFWVSYKGTDGKCYMTAVYASYTYKGGGTYASVPTWGADAPEEMSCLNMSK